MISLIENHEQQYAVLSADITAQIGLLAASATRDRRQLISNIEKHVEEAQELLEQIELEIMEVESTKRQRLIMKLDCYRVELKRLTVEYIKARSLKQASINYDSGEENEVLISSDQKQRLLNNSERLERTGKKLEESYRVVLETEEIGTRVMQDLSHQRETIERSRNRLRETNEDLGHSSRITRSMLFRNIQQKIILYVVGICFVTAISIAIYLTMRE